MAYSHLAEPSTTNRNGRSTAYGGSSQAASPAKRCGCGCGGESPPASTCCDTECFERPRYFCGHLLTDADLSLEQRYVIGKNKLYHRALHGHGIVCGLRLTCDPACCGDVIVGEGFAIDDCGNDLIVCDSTRFDVMAALQDKGLLYAAAQRDNCDPPASSSDCEMKDCFYIVACYDEEAGEFTTPLTPACGPSPKDCEPTRIRERVRFDVLDKLPKSVDPLVDLEHRIEHCFKLLTEGPFAEALKEPRTQEALSGSATPGNHDDYYNQIRKLRVLFKRYLECHPDKYNCQLAKDIDAIACPPNPQTGTGYTPPTTPTTPGQPASNTPPGSAPPNQPQGTPSQNYGTDMRDAAGKLVDLAYSHVMSCVMGELAFSCPAPAHAGCVVLGTVEVENGCVVRVCNCPRDYVWSFGSFWQVLMAKLFGSLACRSTDQSGLQSSTGAATNADGSGTQDGPSTTQRDCGCGCGGGLGHHPCCQEFAPEDGPEAFVKTLQDGGKVAADLATTMLDAIKAIRCSVQYGFSPTRTDSLLLRAKRGQPATDVVAEFRKQGAQIQEREMPTNPRPLSILDVFDSSTHVTMNDPLLAETKAGLIVDIRKQPVLDRMTSTEGDVSAMQGDVTSLLAQMTALQADVQALKAQIAGQNETNETPIVGRETPDANPRRPKKNGRRGGPA